MVYHLKNWEYLRDLIKMPAFSKEEFIADIIDESGATRRGNIRHIVQDIAETCGDMDTKEGFETCLLLFREDLSESFRGLGTNEAFEKFLENLDKGVGEIKKRWYEEHSL